MLTHDDTTVAAEIRLATRRAGLRPFETYVLRGSHEVTARDLLRSALDTNDAGARKLTCSVLRNQHHLLFWYNVRHGELIGERE